jgi:hypothetical protein
VRVADRKMTPMTAYEAEPGDDEEDPAKRLTR